METLSIILVLLALMEKRPYNENNYYMTGHDFIKLIKQAEVVWGMYNNQMEIWESVEGDYNKRNNYVSLDDVINEYLKQQT